MPHFTKNIGRFEHIVWILMPVMCFNPRWPSLVAVLFAKWSDTKSRVDVICNEQTNKMMQYVRFSEYFPDLKNGFHYKQSGLFFNRNMRKSSRLHSQYNPAEKYDYILRFKSCQNIINIVASLDEKYLQGFTTMCYEIIMKKCN